MIGKKKFNNISKTLKRYYIFIPILQLSFFALFAWFVFLRTSFKYLSEFYIYYTAAIKVLIDPKNLYTVDGYAYLPSFAYVVSPLSLLSFDISRIIFFVINYIIYLFVILEYDKILRLKIKKESRRLLYLLIVSGGFSLIIIFWFSQVKFIILLLFLLVLRREMQYEIENKKKGFKFKFINYNLLAFALGMAPYYFCIIFIYFFHDVKLKEVFKRENVKNYVILFSAFLFQNFILLIYPNLILDYLSSEVVLYRVGAIGVDISVIPMFYLSDFQIQITLLQSRILKLIFIFIMVIATLFISFNRNWAIQYKISLFFLVYLLTDVIRNYQIFVVVFPFILLLFVDFQELFSENFFNKKRIVLTLGILSIYLCLFSPPIYIFYYNLFIKDDLLIFIKFRYLIFSIILVLSYTYLIIWHRKAKGKMKYLFYYYRETILLKFISKLKKKYYIGKFIKYFKKILNRFLIIVKIKKKPSISKESIILYRLIKKLFKEPKCFFDCGPGVIDSEAWFIKKYWPNCKIIGIEACPDRYKNLKRKYPGILINKALDFKNSEEYGYIGGTYGQFMFGLEKEDPNKGKNDHIKIKVKTVTLDYIEQKYGPFESIFIWADIEGAELRMLQGATQILSSGKVIGLNLELWPRNAQKIWKHYTGIRCTADEIISYLKKFGYKIYGNDVLNLIKNDPDFESKGWFKDYIFIKE